jgi:hypothetical protein
VGFRNVDFGLRNVAIRRVVLQYFGMWISDCGMLRYVESYYNISECGFRIAECCDTSSRITIFRNPKSTFRNQLASMIFTSTRRFKRRVTSDVFSLTGCVAPKPIASTRLLLILERIKYFRTSFARASESSCNFAP